MHLTVRQRKGFPSSAVGRTKLGEGDTSKKGGIEKQVLLVRSYPLHWAETRRRWHIQCRQLVVSSSRHIMPCSYDG